MNSVLKYILPPVTILLGVAVMVVLIQTKPQTAKATTEAPALLVQVAEAVETTESATIEAQGTVQAARQLTVQPQVSGEIVELNPGLVAGGTLRKGEQLLKINARDYQLAIRQQQANIAQAQLNLQVEQGRGKIARREWELVGDDVPDDAEGRALALREPYKRSARASLAAAHSGLAQAQLNLSRTRIEAPFNALVLAENIDVGQVVGPGSPLATLVGTDEFWVQVSMPVEDLQWIDLPAAGQEGSLVRITQRAGASSVQRTGRVLRLLGDVDPAGRMARVIVSVKDPMDLDSGKQRLPLLIGAFVQASIDGRALTRVTRIPRTALRRGEGGAERVWVMTSDDTLDIRTVQVALRQRDTVLLSEGVKPGEKIVTSRIDTPVQGMKLRTGSAPIAQEDEAKDNTP